jgi:hypothetical protein
MIREKNPESATLDLVSVTKKIPAAAAGDL